MRSWRFAVTFGVVVVCALWASIGWAQEGIGERIGKTVDQTMRQIREDGKGVAGQIRAGFEEARAMIDRMGVAGRVYARLRWDKALVGGSIAIDVDRGGLTTVRGTVPTETAKAKAIELTRQTIGVENVRDELEVVPTQSQQRRSVR